MSTAGPKPEGADLAWRKERFRAIYDEYHLYVWRYCLRRCDDGREAEEAFNSTFMTSWQRLDDLSRSQPVRPWLTVIARNHLRNAWRKAGRYERMKQRLMQHAAPNSSPDPADLSPSGGRFVLDVLAGMKRSDQEILKLAAWEDLSQREMAEILECSENAVKIRLHRARARFDNAMDNAKKDLERSETSDDVETSNSLKASLWRKGA